jgi:hypothetical protein
MAPLIWTSISLIVMMVEVGGSSPLRLLMVEVGGFSPLRLLMA